MFSAFQSNAFQNNAFQIEDTPTPRPDTHDGATPDQVRKWKKYLKELKEYQENKTRPKRRKSKSRSIKTVIEFKVEKFPDFKSLEAEISMVERMILQIEQQVKAHKELMAELDDEEAILLLL